MIGGRDLVGNREQEGGGGFNTKNKEEKVGGRRENGVNMK